MRTSEESAPEGGTACARPRARHVSSMFAQNAWVVGDGVMAAKDADHSGCT